MHKEEEKEDRHGMVIGGIIVLGIGIVFLLSNLNIIPHIGRMWPLILVVVGIALLMGAIVKKEPKKEDRTSGSP
ncbi:MAG: LiaI-LiaF-like domain-containing protein [Candidatus Zixiibacteriota bacterium]